MSASLIAGLILLADQQCAAMTCGEPPGGCPQPTTQNNHTLYFLNITSFKCYSIQTSGCEGYGWNTFFQCWVNCRLT
uniref:Putative secreted protein n=1 Tax=Amblyomma aureolatum TaxID=187763 RepID=A0A1E1WWE0_9ACAR